MSKVGRNDPCPCGSGKKYKNCCALKSHPGVKRKFTAKVLTHQGKDLIERTFGGSINAPKELPKLADMPDLTKNDNNS